MRRAVALYVAVGLAVMALSTAAGRGDAGSAARANVPEGKWILVSIHQKSLSLYEGTSLLKTYAVATGAQGTPTPIGFYRVNSRFAGEMSGFGTRFLGINVPWGMYGIHGTNKPGSIGYNASHGCVRMRVKDSEALYAAVPNGTRVIIEGGPYGYLDDSLRPLSEGDRDSRVVELQNRLRALGYYHGASDGIYGAGTKAAVRQARSDLGLPAQGHADYALYSAIGLMLFE